MSSKLYVIFAIISLSDSNPSALKRTNIGISIKWKGKGLKEIGFDSKTKKTLVKIDPIYFRPTDIKELRGDSSKARKELKWKPKTSFKQLVEEMMVSDLKSYKYAKKNFIKE